MNAEAIRLHDEALRLMPDGADHDSSLCPICTDQARASDIPPASGRSDDDCVTNGSDQATEGGRNPRMETLTQETHEALVKAAVEKATEQASARISELESQVSSLTEERDSAQAEVATLNEENERLNGELDTAQVELKTAQDENAQLKTDIEERDEQARLSEIASQRAQQVRNLGLFTDDQISEKSSRWATVTDEEWAERLEEWKAVKGDGAPVGNGDGADDKASAMSGSSESDTASADKKTSPRRAVLGLD